VTLFIAETLPEPKSDWDWKQRELSTGRLANCGLVFERRFGRPSLPFFALRHRAKSKSRILLRNSKTMTCQEQSE
jgi:hypothetical protein